MIECYRKGKKERGNIKSLWKENKTVVGKLPVSETRRPFFFLLWNFAAAGRLSLVAVSGAAL